MNNGSSKSPTLTSERPFEVPIGSGTVIARHKITEYIGHDEFFAYHKAFQASMRRTVIMTVLRSKYAKNKEARKRFFTEARSIAKLNHPNLLSLFDLGEDKGVCFFTTELFDGMPLANFLAEVNIVSSLDRLMIATQVARALAYAESEGIKTLYLKPNDILLTARMHVRLSHVSAAKPLRGGQPEPILHTLVGLMHLVVTGEGLPAELRQPGAAEDVILPTTDDPVGERFYELVEQLMSEPGAYANVGVFADKLEKLLENTERWMIINAELPGGESPEPLDGERQQQFPVVAAVIITVVVVSVIAGILAWAVLR